MNKRIMLALAAGAAAIMGTTSAAVAAPTSAAPEPLNILLTNDDGYAAPGIAAVRQALTAAGHSVTVVAPAADASGGGTGVNLKFGGILKATNVSEGVWSVEGSPGDAVYFGLRVVMKDNPPDLVVSGTNFGHNTGGITNHSGTVGGAIAAMENEIPAIAVSTEIDLQAGPPATIAAFPATAKYTADLIEKLQSSSGGGRLLPRFVALNVNYPITTSGPKGTKVTTIGRSFFVKSKYQPAGPGTYVIVPEFPTTKEPVLGADTTALAADYVSVTPMDGSWAVLPSFVSALDTRLKRATR